LILLQLKAKEVLSSVGADYVFDLDIRDYNLWMREKMPVILALFDASRKRAFCLAVQRNFRDVGRQPRRGAKTVRARVPMQQAVNRRAIATMRELKRAAIS
jgi:hypothetical protein